MAQAEDVEQVYALIRNSWYGRLDLGNLEKGQSLEEPCREVIDRIYELTSSTVSLIRVMGHIYES